MHDSPTQACLITPPGEGGIGIIAVAGADAPRVMDAVFAGTRRRASDLPVGAIAHGTIRRGGQVVDEVIVARVNGPTEGGAYFEVNCHGGTLAVQAVLRCMEQAGAQAVEWQRFSHRPATGPGALDGSRIRAAALALLPDARTRLTAAMLLHQANGALTRELDALADDLSAERAPAAAGRLDALLRTAAFGRALIAPPRVALLGPPNAGKSTLFNALLREERVIVHEQPGTTRDVITATLSLRGVPFELMDAAGIRTTDDEMESHAVRRAGALAGQCEVALLVFDAREDARAALAAVPPLAPGVRAILVANKCDLLPAGCHRQTCLSVHCEGPSPEHRQAELVGGTRTKAGLPPRGGATAGLPGRAAAGPAGLGQASLVCVSARSGQNLDVLEAALLEPCEALIEPVRAGEPVVFDEAIEAALRAVADGLRSGGCARAAALLRSMRGGDVRP